MAKLGMPTFQAAFEERGIEAIERSTRGIVALILEESADTIAKVGTLTKLYTINDIPTDLTEDNKDYIIKAFLGYVKAPYRVLVALQPTSEDTNAEKFQTGLNLLLTERFDWLAIPTITSAQTEYVGTWIKTARDNNMKKIKAVLPGYSADHEGVVNFSNTKIVTTTKEYTPAEYTARIAGLICGTPMTISATYAPLSEVVNCDRHTKDENDTKVNAGEFFVWYDGEKFKMSRAMNSLVTTTQGKLESYQTIKIIEIMDMIYDDINTTVQDSYIGKYTNDSDNKVLLMNAILAYLKKLEEGRLLKKNTSTVSMNIEAIKNYVMGIGKYTKDELAKMSDDEIAFLDTKKKVFLTSNVTILDAMEDIDIVFNI